MYLQYSFWKILTLMSKNRKGFQSWRCFFLYSGNTSHCSTIKKYNIGTHLQWFPHYGLAAGINISFVRIMFIARDEFYINEKIMQKKDKKNGWAHEVFEKHVRLDYALLLYTSHRKTNFLLARTRLTFAVYHFWSLKVRYSSNVEKYFTSLFLFTRCARMLITTYGNFYRQQQEWTRLIFFFS